jgi:hypothetical protein
MGICDIFFVMLFVCKVIDIKISGKLGGWCGDWVLRLKWLGVRLEHRECKKRGDVVWLVKGWVVFERIVRAFESYEVAIGS